MANILQDGVEWMIGQLQSSCPCEVTFTQDGYSVTITCTLGSSLLKTTDSRGATHTERTDRDFIFPAADYILNSVLCLPKRGAIASVVFGSVTQKYVILAPGNEPHYRYSDSFQTILRVHAKRKAD